MRRASMWLLLVCVVLAGTIMLIIPKAAAQFASGGPFLGSVDVTTMPRVEADVQNSPGTFLAVAGDTAGTVLRTETTGPGTGPVAVIGTVALNGATIAALNGQTCAFGVARHFVLSSSTFSGVRTTIPPLLADGGYPSLVGRSDVTIAMESGGAGHLYAMPENAPGDQAECATSDGGVLATGFIVEHGGNVTFRASSANRVTVIGCTGADVPGGTHHISYVEDSCSQ